MALLILSSNKESIYNISKTELNARTVLGNFDDFQLKNCVKQISEQQFNDLNLGLKMFDYVDGDNVFLKDVVAPPGGFGFNNTSEINQYIEIEINVFKNCLQVKNFSNNPQFKQEIENYLEFLKNFDANSITLPMNSTFHQYLSNNNLINPINYLQF
jgi:hypothetical protein